MNNDYYTSTGRKIGDFFIGFIGILIALFICIMLPNLLSRLLYENSGSISPELLPFFYIILPLVLIVSGIVISNHYNRRYILIGIISGIIIPLLVFGACLLIIIPSLRF